MRHLNRASSDPLIFALEDRPPPLRSILAAVAHLAAIVASIMAAPLLLAGVIGLDEPSTRYVVSASLFISGIATFVQVYRFGWVGSGLLSVQGTSFAFIGPMAYAAATFPEGTSSEEIAGVLLGSCAAGGIAVAIAGTFLKQVQKIITPVVAGTVVFLLGISLVFSAATNLNRIIGAAASSEIYIICIEIALTFFVILFLSRAKQPWLRLLSIPIGIVAGCVTALLAGNLEWNPGGTLDIWFVPQFFRFPLNIDPLMLAILMPIFLVSLTESIGDLTATSSVSQRPVEGAEYGQRLRGGIVADGLNTVLASLFGSFPNTTFSQNNAVIRITGVASRHVGLVLSILLIIMGSIPLISAGFLQIPGSVINGATIFLFGMIAITGLGLAVTADPVYGSKVLIGSTLCAFVLAGLPQLLNLFHINLPEYAAIIMGFPVATGILIAIILTRVFRA